MNKKLNLIFITCHSQMHQFNSDNCFTISFFFCFFNCFLLHFQKLRLLNEVRLIAHVQRKQKKMSFSLVFAVNMIVIITLYELMSISVISTVCFMYKISRISIIIIVIHLSYRFTRYNSKINLTRATFF